MALKFTEDRPDHRITRTAASTITARRFVKANGSDYQKCDPCVANDFALGVAESGGSSGDNIPIITDGQVMIDAGGTIVPGDELLPDANGKAVKRGTTATVLYPIRAVAVSGAASGEQVCAKLTHYSVWGGNAS